MSLSNYEKVVKLDYNNPQHNEMFKEIEKSFAYQVLLLMKRHNCKWSDIKDFDVQYYHDFEDDKHLNKFKVTSIVIVKDLRFKTKRTIIQKIKSFFDFR